MSEWGRLQDVLHDEFDRQGVKGVDVNALIETIVNVRGLFPGLLAPTPDTTEATLRADPYTERGEHERQSMAGTHNFDPQCPFCFFDQFDAEVRAALQQPAVEGGPE